MARTELKKHGISCEGKHAIHMERSDYRNYDYLIGMEQYNVRNMMRILGSDPEGKVYRLLDFTENPRDIDDPWYTRDFRRAYQEILEGCQGLMERLLKHGMDAGRVPPSYTLHM